MRPETLSPYCLFSPTSSPLSSILIVPQLAKSEPPSCEGLSLFFSQPPERQQAVSKSVPHVTSVEETVRAVEEPRRRRLPCLAACQCRNTIHSQRAGEHPLSACCLQGLGICPARGFMHGKELPRTESVRGISGEFFDQSAFLHPDFVIIARSFPSTGGSQS